MQHMGSALSFPACRFDKLVLSERINVDGAFRCGKSKTTGAHLKIEPGVLGMIGAPGADEFRWQIGLRLRTAGPERD